MNRRKTLLVAVLTALLAITALWSYGQMASQRAAVQAVGADLEACYRMSAEMEAVSRRPTMAAEHEKLPAKTTRLIERAAKSAGITTDSLVRITPEPPRRLGDTVYKEKPTQILLKNAGLKQLVTFVHTIVSADQGLQARSIRLSAPRQQDLSSLWTSEIVLTYLIYDPPRTER